MASEKQVIVHGKPVEICGDCVQESDGSVLEYAVGIETLTVFPYQGDEFRGLDRSTGGP